jgi:hypothetical protein
MPLNSYGRQLTQELTPLNDKRHNGPFKDLSAIIQILQFIRGKRNISI